MDADFQVKRKLLQENFLKQVLVPKILDVEGTVKNIQS